MAVIDKLSPMGFGTSLFTDFSRNVRSTSGKQKVIEGIVGRLVDTPWYAPSFGVDLINRLQRIDLNNLDTLSSECEQEILKDDRVESVVVEITYDSATQNINVYVNGYLTDDDEKSFTLISNVNLLNIESITFNQQ
jgi:hypothetical protein